MTNQEVSDEFWKIVDFNQLQDAVVPVAAEDPDLRRAAMWLILAEGKAEVPASQVYEKVVDRVIESYGLLPDQVAPVLNLCDAIVCEELQP